MNRSGRTPVRILNSISTKRSCLTVANNGPVAVFDRLAGLETEYAIHFRAQSASRISSSRLRLYQQLVGALRRRLPAAEAIHFKEGVFLANGGAVWYETERMTPEHGLIEGSTPECRGPRQLIICQRAQDRLLQQAAEGAPVAGEFALIKNDRDAQNNIYGAQENYEARLATGWRLAAWRTGLTLLLPLAAVAWLTVPLIVLLLITYLLLAAVLYLPLHLLLGRPRKLAVALFGEDLVTGQPTGAPMPPWLEAIVRRMTQLLTIPLATVLWALSKAFAFRPQRRQLTAFLVSRPLIAGAGMLDDHGNMRLSDKGPAINCRLGMGGLIGERPLFVFGHFFKTLCSWRDCLDLAAPRQRLQIGVGDSNMCQLAEYLRVGATMLVLDVIESGEMPPVPQLRRPIDALHHFCRDLSLTAEAEADDGRCYTALELQRLYLDACRRFLQRRPYAPEEAFDVLRRWEETLEHLVEYKLVGDPPDDLIGNLDWITKKSLIDQAGGTWPEKKKIDIRYHELSEAGYHYLLSQAGTGEEIVTEQEIERAMRNPPPDSPATTRGRYIREFAQTGAAIAANWKQVWLGSGMRRKVIRLRAFGVSRSQEETKNAVRLDGHQRNDG